LEKNLFLVLVSLLYGLGAGLFNSLSSLSIKVLDFLMPLLDLPTKFGRIWDGSEIQRSPWIVSIDHFKWGEVSGLT